MHVIGVRQVRLKRWLSDAVYSTMQSRESSGVLTAAATRTNMRHFTE